MARKRMIDPSFWSDEKLGECEPLARMLFMGLISQADDEGRLKGNSKLIKSAVFPYDDEITAGDVEDWIILLAAPERRLIVRYEDGHQKYIVIPNFKKHQTINKPQPSKLPAPLPDNYRNDTVTVNEQLSNDAGQKKLIEEKLIEGESKGREGEFAPTTHSTFNDPIKDKIYALAIQCELKKFNIIAADELFFFIDKVEFGVIEQAIKKSYQKHMNYAVNTLMDWFKDGKTTLELINPNPKGGDPPNGRTEQWNNGISERTNGQSLTERFTKRT